jgi:hypothetical protein
MGGSVPTTGEPPIFVNAEEQQDQPMLQRDHHTTRGDAEHIGPRKEPPPFAVYYFVHAIRCRITQPLTHRQWRSLRLNSNDAFMLRSGYDKRLRTSNDPRPVSISKNYIKGYLDNPLVVVKPNEEALRFLNALPRVLLNYSELARDQIVTDAEQVHDRFIEHFVHPRHGTHEMVFRITGEDDENADDDEVPVNPRRFATRPQSNPIVGDRTTGTSYTGQRRRGHLFACYSDLPSKETGELSCFHLEARYQGTTALRRLGIDRPADLIDFAHADYWNEVLKHIYRIDFERLGRYETNRRRRERRRKALIICSGRYNKDAAVGSSLYHVFGQHPNQPYHSLQRFLDVYKPRSRGFLTRIRWADIVNPAFPFPCKTRPWETVTK